MAAHNCKYFYSPGDVVGYLTVLKKLPSERRPHSRLLCECKCGSKLIAYSNRLGIGKKKSCGCLQLALASFDKLFAGNCTYCGCPPSKTVQYGDSSLPFTFNGIDRVDNQQGYINGNVVSCCLQCNRAKGTMKAKDFIKWIKRAYRHIKNKGTFRQEQ